MEGRTFGWPPRGRFSCRPPRERPPEPPPLPPRLPPRFAPRLLLGASSRAPPRRLRRRRERPCRWPSPSPAGLPPPDVDREVASWLSITPSPKSSCGLGAGAGAGSLGWSSRVVRLPRAGFAAVSSAATAGSTASEAGLRVRGERGLRGESELLIGIKLSSETGFTARVCRDGQQPRETESLALLRHFSTGNTVSTAFGGRHNKNDIGFRNQDSTTSHPGAEKFHERCGVA